MKTLAEAWTIFEHATLPRAASAELRRNVRLAFFAGAAYSFEIVTGTGQAAPLPEDDAEAEGRLRVLQTEIDKFTRDEWRAAIGTRES